MTGPLSAAFIPRRLSVATTSGRVTSCSASLDWARLTAMAITAAAIRVRIVRGFREKLDMRGARSEGGA